MAELWKNSVKLRGAVEQILIIEETNFNNS